MTLQNPTDATSTTTRRSNERYRRCREDSDLSISSDIDSGCCSWAQCIDLSYVASEPFQSLERRTIEAHKKLWGSAKNDAVTNLESDFTAVLPKLQFTPRPPRTGSTVMSNWCAQGSVATSATVETVLSRQTEASVSLADHDDEDEDVDNREGTARQQTCWQRAGSPCQWGYFVDSATPPAAADKKRFETELKARSIPLYRRFMSREIEASARYDGLAPLDAGDHWKSLRRVQALPNLRMENALDSDAVANSAHLSQRKL